MSGFEHAIYDPAAPHADACARILAEAGVRAVPGSRPDAAGVHFLRGLDASNAAVFAAGYGAEGPLIALVAVADLQSEPVAIAAGSAHAYFLTDDPPEVTGATLISGRRRWDLDRRLADSEARYRLLAENAGDVIWTYDIHADRFDFVSPSVRRFRGITPEEAMAESPERAFTPESLAEFRGLLASRLVEFRQTGLVHPHTGIYRQRHADGRELSAEITTSILPGPDGEPDKVLGVARDATERMAAEQALKAALGERDTLLRELRHRIKNTLALSGSLLSLAQSKARVRADADLFAESRSRIQAMAMLYERLLQSPDQTSIDLGAYFRSLCAALEDAYAGDDVGNRGASISVDAVSIAVDSRRAVSMGLALNEAVTNALKHAPAADRPLAIAVTARRSSDGSQLVVTVADDGRGLPEGFDPAASEGLGCLLVRSLAEQLGGTSTMRPGQSGGTVVTLTVPAG